MKSVYTIDDLVSREVLDSGADKPARLAVLGWPISHSASPQMHQAALDFHDIDARYIRLEVEPGAVAEAFARMRALGFIGCNVTVPHKLDALANCTELDPDALALGSVNTVKFDRDATCGFNTDGSGFTRAVEKAFGVSLASLRVCIAGAGGGAGQAIATQCALLGAEKLVLINRTLEKLASLAGRLRDIGGSEVTTHSFDDPLVLDECLSCELIVNTSSVGLKPGDPSILPAGCLKPEHMVYDTIYQPPVTPLLALAMDAGCQTSNGLSMLLEQGALAFLHWFPGKDPLAIMRGCFSHH